MSNFGGPTFTFSKHRVKITLMVIDLARITGFLHLFDFSNESAQDVKTAFSTFEKQFWLKVSSNDLELTDKKIVIEMTPFDALTLLSFLSQDDIKPDFMKYIMVGVSVSRYDQEVRRSLHDEHIMDAFAERFAKKCREINKIKAVTS